MEHPQHFYSVTAHSIRHTIARLEDDEFARSGHLGEAVPTCIVSGLQWSAIVIVSMEHYLASLVEWGLIIERAMLSAS